MILIAYLVLVFACLTQGIIDAILYSRRGADALKGNEHGYLVIHRATWMLLIGTGVLLRPIDVFLLSLSFLVMFSFFHNGSYGIFKNFIFTGNFKFKNWSYVSPEDEAKIHFDFSSRFIMFLFSIVIVGISFFV